MRIIIVGDGKVGYALAQHLTSENHSVTIIDNDEDALSKASEALDVMCILGNGGNTGVLKDAGAARADVVIAATNGDEINMVICLAAKKLGARYTIARIRDTSYSSELGMLKRELDIDMVINPEQATAVEISRLLRFPAATNIETFYRGRVEMLDFKAQAGDFFVDKPIRSLTRSTMRSVLFCALEHEGELIIPGGDTIIRAGDVVHVLGDVAGVTDFFKTLGRMLPKIRDVMILGGGRVSVYLARLLEHSNIKIKMIEQDYDKCTALSAAFPGAIVINGDGTDQELLDSENVSNAGCFVALTDRDEYNFIVALYAMHQGVAKVIAKANRQNYSELVRDLGINSVVSPKELVANQILQVVRGLQNSKGNVMETLYKIVGGKAEAIEFSVTRGASYLDVPLKTLNIKKGILIAAIARQGKVIIPEGSDHIEGGDNIIIVVSGGRSILDLNDIFQDDPGAAQ